jgi:hypothetical protein
MDGISSVWLYPIILAAGALQAWGPPMNGALRVALTNPWLASLISFLPVVALLLCLLLCAPRPLPTLAGVAGMPWWAPLGGLVGALAVVAGLLFVDKVGAGAFARAHDNCQHPDVSPDRQVRHVRHAAASVERDADRRRVADGRRDCAHLARLKTARDFDWRSGRPPDVRVRFPCGL